MKKSINLIPFLKERYNCPIGYSGHEEDLEPTVIAVALGATVIERHITLSHDMWGTDQKSSLEVNGDGYALQESQGHFCKIMGKAEKTVTPSEVAIRKKLREDKMIYFVDIDDTICRKSSEGYTDYENSQPLPERISIINKLYDEGHTVVYWTAHGSGCG